MAKRKKSYSTPKFERMSGQRYVQESYKEGSKQHRAASKWYTKAKARENANNGVSSEKKALNYQKNGSRSYRPTPRFGGTVYGLVSLILVIGILGTVFLAVQNTGRLKGEPFVYFSPSEYLNGISSGDIVVPAGNYTVRLERRFIPIISGFFEPEYFGYIDVGSKTYKSKETPGESYIKDGTAIFTFDIDGSLYQADPFPLQGPVLPGESLGYIYKVELPEFIYKWNDQPDFSIVVDSWDFDSSANFYDEFADALKVTASFVKDFLVYQGNLIIALLPWNSVRSSDAIPMDGVKVAIPWRDDNMEVVTGVVEDYSSS